MQASTLIVNLNSQFTESHQLTIQAHSLALRKGIQQCFNKTCLLTDSTTQGCH